MTPQRAHHAFQPTVSMMEPMTKFMNKKDDAQMIDPHPWQGTRIEATAEEFKPDNNALPFPWKLHEMLDESEKMGLTNIVSWLPDRKSFRVHNPDTFVQDIMPKWFRQSKYKSFQRQCKSRLRECDRTFDEVIRLIF